MIKPKDIIKQIDSFIVKQIDILVSSTPWQQASYRVNLLKESHQKAFNHITTNLLTFSPLIIVAIILVINLNMRSSLNSNKSLVRTIDNIARYKNQLTALEKTKLSRTKVSSKSTAQSMLNKILSVKNTSTSKVKITDFSSTKFKSSTIQSSKMTVSFSDFSTTDFVNLLKGLLNNEKALVSSIKLSKIEKTRSLTGTFKVQHYSKAAE